MYVIRGGQVRAPASQQKVRSSIPATGCFACVCGRRDPDIPCAVCALASSIMSSMYNNCVDIRFVQCVGVTGSQGHRVTGVFVCP